MRVGLVKGDTCRILFVSTVFCQSVDNEVEGEGMGWRLGGRWRYAGGNGEILNIEYDFVTRKLNYAFLNICH